MAKLPSNGKRPRRPTDVNQLAHHLVALSTGQLEEDPKATDAEISRVMSELGRRGGKIGGKRRLVTMTSEERSQIAYRAAQARWGKRKKAKKP